MDHKDLFPLDNSDIAGTLLIGLGLMIAAAGGVGGGGIVVPLLIIVCGFHPKQAIPLSNFTILGSSITNMVLNLPKIHPEARRPLVDWDLILVMEPLTMAGAVVGALIGKVLPDWILVFSLVILLAFTAYTTLDKARSQYKKETAAQIAASKSLLARVVEEDEEKSVSVGLLSEEAREMTGEGVEDGVELKTLSTTVMAQSPDPDADELERLLESESTTPIDKVIVISVMVVVVMGLNLIKGGSGSFPSPLGIVCGTTSYWMTTVLVLLWVLGISIWARNELIAKWTLKKRLRYKYLTGDVEWNERNTLVYPALCFFAGFFAGMFGIGGGIVKGPLMLQMGVHPMVASATVAVMIMFTSVAATTMFIAFGTLIWDYAWYFFILGLFTTVIGQFGVSYLVDKYKRYSYISISIGAVVALSTILMAVQSVFSLVDAQNAPSGSSSSSVCS